MRQTTLPTEPIGSIPRPVSLFELEVGNFYIALAGERDPEQVLKLILTHMNVTGTAMATAVRRGQA